MTLYARLQDSRVVELIAHDESLMPFEKMYAGAVVASCVVAPSGVTLGQWYENGQFYPGRPSQYHDLVEGVWVENAERKAAARKAEIARRLAELDDEITRVEEDIVDKIGLELAPKKKAAREEKVALRAELASL